MPEYDPYEHITRVITETYGLAAGTTIDIQLTDGKSAWKLVVAKVVVNDHGLEAIVSDAGRVIFKHAILWLLPCP